MLAHDQNPLKQKMIRHIPQNNSVQIQAKNMLWRITYAPDALTLEDFSSSSVITTHVDLVNHTCPLDRGQEYRICELFQAAQ